MNHSLNCDKSILGVFKYVGVVTVLIPGVIAHVVFPKNPKLNKDCLSKGSLAVAPEFSTLLLRFTVRTCSNSISCCMKLMFGDIILLLARTNSNACSNVIVLQHMR